MRRGEDLPEDLGVVVGVGVVSLDLVHGGCEFSLNFS